MTASEQVYLGLGSNLGDRERNLERAIRSLQARGLAVSARSSLYLTEPFQAPPQEWFLNAAIGGSTELSPEALLRAGLDVEREMGRQRTVPRGPRTIDIDLLLYGEQVRSDPGLTLPHPRLHERLFVLVPLEEIAPQARHPLLARTVAELRLLCRDTSRVLKHQPAPR